MVKKREYFEQIQSKSVKDLVLERKNLRNELFNLQSKNAMKGLKETHFIKIARRKIAQVNTLLSHKIKSSYGSTR